MSNITPETNPINNIKPAGVQKLVPMKSKLPPRPVDSGTTGTAQNAGTEPLLKPKKPKKQPGAWETEASFDQSATLEELIALQPFHPSSEESGDTWTAAARVPNWMRRRVQKIIEAPNCPYELSSDCIRDAMYLGLRILHMRYKQTTDWSVQTKISMVEDKATAGRRARDRFTAFANGLEEHMDAGDMQEAASLLTDYVAAVLELEDEWLKGRTMTYIRNNKTVREILKYCKPELTTIIDTVIEKPPEMNISIDE